MSELQWIIVVLAFFFLSTVFLWWRARKDMLGAISASLLVLLLAALCLSVSGCTIQPERRPWMEAGVAYDIERNVGSNPACVVRVRAPIGPRGHEDWIVAGVTHHSSCPDQDDRAEINQVEITARIPLGRRQ